jgi:hypothetical protein
MGLSHVTAWGWFWLAWALTALAVELYWVAVNAANTLSRQVWGLERLSFAHPLDLATWTPLHYLIAIVLWGFFAWLSVHLVFGWIR